LTLSLRKLFLYNYKERVQIILYSLCSRIIDSIPRNLKNTYEFTNSLLTKGIHLETEAQGLVSFPYKINNGVFRFFIKKDSSDSRVFEQIILNEEYKTVVEEIRKRKIKVESILDCGANIGLTSMYLTSYFRNARILALEPSKTTFERLELNIRKNSLDRVKLFNKGVWSKNAFLKPDINFRDGEDWSFRLVETSVKEEAILEAVGIDDLMKHEQISHIDLMKIDIEGGEVELFKSKHLPWLQKTKIIALEIHDEFKCRIEIERKLVDHGFDIFHSGELTIGFNKSFDK
jgi:FkbM family methyltransferase